MEFNLVSVQVDINLDRYIKIDRQIGCLMDPNAECTRF